MEPMRAALALAALLLPAGCSSPASRIKANQETFEGYPAEVQEKIRAGRADVGFTKEMSLMALGKPDRKYARTTDTGTQEIWSYIDGRTSTGVGLSVGSGGFGTVYGGGVSVGSGDYHHPNERLRLVFDGDRVTAVEERKK